MSYSSSFLEYRFMIDFMALRELLMIVKDSELEVKAILRASKMAQVLAV